MVRAVVACFLATIVWAFALSRPKRRPVAVRVSAVTSVEPRVDILTSTDRCEVRGCGAQAYFRGLFEPISDEQKTSAIDFCRHHFAEVEQAVRAVAYHVIDESARLLARPQGHE